jgi:hypothetical protein
MCHVACVVVVKGECGGGGDPSVNHLIVVDSSGGLPTHSCNYEQGGACMGASSDLDDDIVHNIAPGSPILYLLYSSEAGYCIKEDEHWAIFDAAVRCLWADDPFATVRGSQRQVSSEPLIEVDVDQRGEIVFGGTGTYTGWAKGGGPSVVAGPSGADNALLFEAGQWLQLGESGVEVSGNWTLVCRVHVTAEALLSAPGEGVLLSAAEAVESVSVGASLLAAAGTGGWVVLVVQQILQADHARGVTPWVERNHCSWDGRCDSGVANTEPDSDRYFCHGSEESCRGPCTVPGQYTGHGAWDFHRRRRRRQRVCARYFWMGCR